MALKKKELEDEYQRSIQRLNTLTSNQATLARRLNPEELKNSLDFMKQALKRVDVTENDLSKLSVIHVTGTKGKGSTCAFTESILRHQGYKTGFYSSPHLAEVRERIRINGEPLSKKKFVHYFNNVYGLFDQTKDDYEEKFPFYFRFLTVLAIRVFLEEKVDVAIIEVGIGGRYDCTNVIKDPIVCGITSLGIDHVATLGDTIEAIAWQKAGIIKPGCKVVTCLNQPPSALAVLSEESKLHKCSLYVAPSLDSFVTESSSMSLSNGGKGDIQLTNGNTDISTNQNKDILLGIGGPIQKINATLALQLANLWLNNHKKGIKERIEENAQQISTSEDVIPLSPFSLTEHVVKGLANTVWGGRCQQLLVDNMRFYVDGAHTEDSLRMCTDWFLTSQKNHKSKLKILIFNVTGGRDVANLMKPFLMAHFDLVIFTSNTTCSFHDDSPDIQFAVTASQLRSQTERNQEGWVSLNSGGKSFVVSSVCHALGVVQHCADMPSSIASLTQEHVSHLEPHLHNTPSSSRDQLNNNNNIVQDSFVSVLITGSLHLVGDCLKMIHLGPQNKEDS